MNSSLQHYPLFTWYRNILSSAFAQEACHIDVHWFMLLLSLVSEVDYVVSLTLLMSDMLYKLAGSSWVNL